MHNGANLAVVEGLLVVLQGDGYTVRFLACGGGSSFVDVEQRHALEKFTLSLLHGFLNLRECHTGVNKKGKVSAHGLGFRQWCVCHLMVCHKLEECVPVEGGINDVLLNVEAFEQVVTENPEFAYALSGAALDVEASGEKLPES